MAWELEFRPHGPDPIELLARSPPVRHFELPPDHAILRVASPMKLIGTTKPTVIRAIGTLMAASVLAEVTGRKRDRRFAYDSYFRLLSAGTGAGSQTKEVHHLTATGLRFSLARELLSGDNRPAS